MHQPLFEIIETRFEIARVFIENHEVRPVSVACLTLSQLSVKSLRPRDDN